MIRTVIIEDEKNAREGLKKMLAIIAPDCLLVGESGLVKESIQMIKEMQPELVFMDIKLEDGNSFQILNELNNINFKIIFTTAYNQYAIKAFKFSATDYLLKPIDPNELKVAIEKSILNLKKEKHHKELIDLLKHNIQGKEEKIILKTTEQQYILFINEIIRLEADAAYTIFYTKKEKIIVSKNLKHYQDLLGDEFIRCHQSHLINTNYIVSIHKNESLQLSNGELIPIASRKKKEILKHLKNL